VIALKRETRSGRRPPPAHQGRPQRRRHSKARFWPRLARRGHKDEGATAARFHSTEEPIQRFNVYAAAEQGKLEKQYQ
jgi:hypothetical protein